MAQKRGAKIVWHLRSALAGEGRDRRSRLIGNFMERFGDAAIAIDRDVAARFPIRLPLEIVHRESRRLEDAFVDIIKRGQPPPPPLPPLPPVPQP